MKQKKTSKRIKAKKVKSKLSENEEEIAKIIADYILNENYEHGGDNK